MGLKDTKDSYSGAEDLFDSVDKKHEIKHELTKLDETLKQIQASQATLRAHAETLNKCIKAEENVLDAMKAAEASCDNVVAGISRAIVAAQQNTVFKTKVSPEHLAELQKLVNDTIEKEKQLLEEHRTKQRQIFAEQERRIEKILSQGRGIWFSYYWAWIMFGTVFVSLIMAVLYVYFRK